MLNHLAQRSFEAAAMDNQQRIAITHFEQALHCIPKEGEGERKPGIPTVADRIAQMVVKMKIEPEMERIFHPGSYG